MIDPCLRVTIAHYPLHSGAQFAGVWFEAVRADAVTCSVKCRVARHRLFQARTPQLPTGTFDLVLVDIDTHFTPNYRPWRQRIAFIPDGDFLKAIRASKASVVTDEIETFTESGLLLKSGKSLGADIIVTATGFNLSVLGDIAFAIDGKTLDFADTVTYRGMMFTGVPNMVWVFGYFRASWTLLSWASNRRS